MLTNLQRMREEVAALEGDFARAGQLGQEIGPSAEVIARVQQLARAYDEAVAAADFGGAADALSMMRDLALELGFTLQDGAVAAMVEGESLARQFANKLDDAAGCAA